ncbi:MAG: ATPase AAA [Candidatus Sericytochromatia bacterium]|nr:MAG: ATPase AAA [Candidatus Sericytochromatia bacterium]
MSRFNILNAKIKEINSDKINISFNGKSLSILLKDLWKDSINYLWEEANINLYYLKEENNIFFLDAEGYLILEPNILISPTDIGNTDKCIRKYYINKRIGLALANYEMIRGTLINNAFDLLIENKIKDSNEIIEKVLEEKIIDISTLEESENKNFDTLKNELETNFTALKLWATHENFKHAVDKNTEPSFISNKYGLSGRIDLLTNNGSEYTTYELKTSKPPENEPWLNHKQQVASYQLLLESSLSYRNPESYLIYSKGNANQLLQRCYIDSYFRRKIINIRNQIVAIDYALTQDYKSDIYRKIIPKAGIGKDICQNCYKRLDCINIANLLDEETEDIFRDILEYSENNKLDSETLEYYHKYFRMVELDRMESRKIFSKVFYDEEELINSGKLIKDLDFQKINSKELYLKSENVLESEIKSGDIVIIYTGQINQCEIVKATVKGIDRYNVYLDLKKEYKEEFFKGKKWNVFIDFMETSYNTMNSALYRLITANTKIKDLIFGRLKPTFKEIDKNLILDNSLNESQKEAIRKALSCNDYLLIQGPPGTGKTHTLAHLIKELVKKGEKVLLSAFTHKAIDNVLIKLISSGFENFLRIGNHESVSKEIHKYLVQEKFKNVRYSDIRNLKSKLNEYPLIACTSVSAITSNLVNSMNFSYAIVDEAGQLNEPSTISVILNADKFILVGDHKQLPPVIQSEEARRNNFDKSLFERLINLNENNNEVLITLNEQYRMNNNIVKFSNEKFYERKLKTPDKIANQKIEISCYDNPIINPEKNLLFVNINKKGDVKVNTYEANIIKNILNLFFDKKVLPSNIGIIAPFRSQVAEIRRKIMEIGNFDELTIDTVDRFQGNDRDLIIFSSVVSDSHHLTEFFEDERRLNVAITRAKKKFIMVGNMQVLSISRLFREFLKYCEIINI